MLWTRLAPAPLEGGGLGKRAYGVRYEVAKDPASGGSCAAAAVRAVPEEAHSVHARDRRAAAREGSTGIASSGDARSATSGGRARRRRSASTPAALRFAFVSCQNYTQGYFPAYADLAVQEDVELVVHLGDYIYEGAGLERRPRP